MEIVKKRKLKKIWSTDAEDLLCKLWRKRIPDLQGLRKNSHVFREISLEMAKEQMVFTDDEVHIKINNLTSKYRKVKALMSSGGSPTDWPLYYKIDDLLNQCKKNSNEQDPLVEQSIPIDYGVYITKSEVNRMGSSIEWLLESSPPTTPENMIVPDMYIPEIPASSSKYPDGKRVKVDSNCVQNVQSDIINELKKTNEQIELQLREIREHDEKMISIEEQRNNLLKQLVDDSRAFQSSVIALLQTNDYKNK